MRPPEWVSLDVERENKYARLAWHGEEQQFAVVDLVPAPLVKRMIKEPWGNRGPVFGSYFDRLRRVPVWVDNVDTSDVMSGRVAHLVRRWSTPLKKRLEDRHEATKREQADSVSNVAGEMGEEMYWRAQRSSEGGTGTHIPNKDLTQADWEKSNWDWKARVAGDSTPLFPEAI